MASSRSSCAAISSAGVSGSEFESSMLRTQRAMPTSTERDFASAARRTFPMAASSFSSAAASASAARPLDGNGSVALALCRFGQSRCQ
eukprot:4508118-Pleurochrysis_carterae.AAC.1